MERCICLGKAVIWCKVLFYVDLFSVISIGILRSEKNDACYETVVHGR